MSHTSNLQTQKYSWIDVARTIGAFFIILIHVSDTYLDSFKSLDLFNWISVVFWNVIPRSGVPLFIAVSGYILLEKEDAINKRIYKLLKPLIFWSLFYALLAMALNAKSNPDFVEQLFLRGLFGIGAFAPHLWFLYMLLGLYISLPLSRLLFRNLDLRGTVFLCFACMLNSLIFNLISAWNLVTGEQLSSFYSLGLGWGDIYFGYFLLPKLIIDKKYSKFRNSHLFIFIIISTLIVFLLTFFTSLERGYFTKLWEDPQSIFIVIQAFSIILLLQSNESRIKKLFSQFVILKKIAEISSRHALGIYAIHFFWVRLTFHIIDHTSIQEYLNHFLGITIILISIFVWLLSLLTSITASKNAFLKQVF